MNQFTLNPIGIVKNNFNEATDSYKIKETESEIILNKSYTDALYTIESHEYIDVVFYFNQSDNTVLKGITKTGNERGAFASRMPNRPNLIGVTSVKLIKREDNKLIVKGLDALNNSPVLDIKSSDTSLFASNADENLIHQSILKSDPRTEIQNNILKEQTDVLLMKAAQLHGHYCPGLALGIKAAVYAMNRMKANSDGLEDLLAITETNNCFSDGIQFVTGCTFGNNALIFKDVGKTAFTLSKRNGIGIRIIAKNDSKNTIRSYFPDHQNLYQKVIAEKNHDQQLINAYKRSSVERAFGTLKIPFDELFSTKETNVKIPEYAPSHDSFICSACKESVMNSRKIIKNNNAYCLICAESQVGMLNGEGIHKD